jgi:hypothetical protein
MVSAKPSQQSDRRRGRVKLRKLVFLYSLPVPRRGRVDGGTLEYGGGHTVGERAVDDVGVPCDPPDIGHAGKAVVGVDVEYVFYGQRCAEEVSSCSVNDSFWFSRRSGCLYMRQDLFLNKSGYVLT